MDKLDPIIRRKRRPLVADVPPIPTKTEPVQPVASAPLVEPAESSAVASPKPEKSSDEDTNY
jgi:hypothetical protein